ARRRPAFLRSRAHRRTVKPPVAAGSAAAGSMFPPTRVCPRRPSPAHARRHTLRALGARRRGGRVHAAASDEFHGGPGRPPGGRRVKMLADLGGCDVRPFAATAMPPRARVRTSGITVAVPAGLPQEKIVLEGDGGAPQITVTAPDNEMVSSGPGVSTGTH